jgi:hypothetical protein
MAQLRDWHLDAPDTRKYEGAASRIRRVHRVQTHLDMTLKTSVLPPKAPKEFDRCSAPTALRHVHEAMDIVETCQRLCHGQTRYRSNRRCISILISAYITFLGNPVFVNLMFAKKVFFQFLLSPFL